MKTSVKQISVAIVLCVAIIATSCTPTLSGVTKQEERSLKDFTGIELAVPAELSLSQGKGYSVSIEADKDILELIETVIQGNSLKIRTERGTTLGWGNVKIKIQITMPDVDYLSVTGSGDIKAVTPITSNHLTTTISGSGDISISELNVSTLKATISGSGDIKLSGSSVGKQAEVKVTGSGDINIRGIEFSDADVTITGSGDAYIVVKENLNARVVGSGDIVYSGNPLVDAKVTGSGRIRNK